MSKDILSVENITMQFGGVVAVNNLSLHIPEGQIVALIGPNGAGKTTAFNCITGVYEPTNGLVKFLDEPMVRNHPSGKMKKLYKGENPLLYTAEYHPEEETKEQMLARDPLARDRQDRLADTGQGSRSSASPARSRTSACGRA